ncbi:MAG TPA: hypothetical protein VK209_08865 [Candidatus Sulfotelmatobacter sp.]|nr:hypothetical protein [Candidatus Sulfotelmatobacter sp.]
MRKVLALMLMLFCLASTIPLVYANPIPDFKHTSAYAAVYVAFFILVIAIIDSAIFLVRRKKVTKQSFLYLLALSFWEIYVVTIIYGGTYSIAIAIGNRITVFGYVTMIITYSTMIVTLIAIVYSGYLINKRLKSNQSPL